VRKPQVETMPKETKDTAKPPAVTAGVKAKEQTSDVTTNKPKKLSFKEQRELEQLPELIAALEAEQAEIAAKLIDAELYRNQPDQAQKLNLRYAEIDELLMSALERWEAMEVRAKS